MCGFAGMIALHGGAADAAVIHRMSAVLKHRGPDEYASHVAGAIGLGFQRLSILDLTPNAHQPMCSEDGQLVLVYNGEIYNYVELRRELETLGHAFRSSGDTEVLLRAYQQWGTDCLPKLNGMWAFLIYDARRGVVFGSRDRFGVKPLYRYQTRDAVFFASEIKAIRASGHYHGGASWSAVSSFLYHGRLDAVDQSPETFYTGIEQVPAASGFELSLSGNLREFRFWSIPDGATPPDGDVAASFGELFEDSVRLRMRSDVPLGVSLSGGLDSSAIVAVMTHLRAGSPDHAHAPALRAFSYMPPEFDESRYIARTERDTGIDLHRVEIDALRLWDSLDRILWYHDEPVHSLTALVGFEVFASAAASGVRVVLSGQGADETIAGYPLYFGNYWYTLAATGKVQQAWDEIGAYCRAHGGNQRTLFVQTLRRLSGTGLRRIVAYGSIARARRMAQLRNNPWFARDLSASLPDTESEEFGGTLDSALRGAIQLAPLPLYLRVEDRNSMAHSVEARLPFLDYRLISLLFSLPDEWKVRGPWTKYVLRESMRGLLPELVRTRIDKMGFPTPAQRWFQGALREPMHDMLASQEVRTRGIYNVDAIRRDLERHTEGGADLSSALFNVAQLESWFRLEKGGAAPAAAEEPAAAS